MNNSVSRDFEDLVNDLEDYSDKVLYPYLKIHIFGPYEGDCFGFLTEIKYRLQEYGFEQTKICVDRDSDPASTASDEELNEYISDESVQFLQEADVAIFFFLDHIFERPELPQRALNECEPPSDDIKDPNSSVSGELLCWTTDYDSEKEQAFVIFEGDMYNSIGSVIAGRPESTDLDYTRIDSEDIDTATAQVRQRAMNWAMNEYRDILKKRHTSDQLS